MAGVAGRSEPGRSWLEPAEPGDSGRFAALLGAMFAGMFALWAASDALLRSHAS